jgi:large subunit ribosomal protein L29
MKNIEELRALNHKQLQEEVLVLRKLQFQQRMRKDCGALDKTHVFRQVRRNIARIKTVLTEKVE